MASKIISFTVPDYIFEGLEKLPIIFNCKLTVNDLFKACAINRMIERGYLDEFGCPIEFPQLDLSNINFLGSDGSSISMESLRSVSK